MKIRYMIQTFILLLSLQITGTAFAGYGYKGPITNSGRCERFNKYLEEGSRTGCGDVRPEDTHYMGCAIGKWRQLFMCRINEVQEQGHVPRNGRRNCSNMLSIKMKERVQGCFNRDIRTKCEHAEAQTTQALTEANGYNLNQDGEEDRGPVETARTMAKNMGRKVNELIDINRACAGALVDTITNSCIQVSKSDRAGAKNNIETIAINCEPESVNTAFLNFQDFMINDDESPAKKLNEYSKMHHQNVARAITLGRQVRGLALCLQAFDTNNDLGTFVGCLGEINRAHTEPVRRPANEEVEDEDLG